MKSIGAVPTSPRSWPTSPVGTTEQCPSRSSTPFTFSPLPARPRIVSGTRRQQLRRSAGLGLAAVDCGAVAVACSLQQLHQVLLVTCLLPVPKIWPWRPPGSDCSTGSVTHINPIGAVSVAAGSSSAGPLIAPREITGTTCRSLSSALPARPGRRLGSGSASPRCWLRHEDVACQDRRDGLHGRAREHHEGADRRGGTRWRRPPAHPGPLRCRATGQAASAPPSTTAPSGAAAPGCPAPAPGGQGPDRSLRFPRRLLSGRPCRDGTGSVAHGP